MKKLLVSLLLIGATLPALAQHRSHGHHGHWQHRSHGHHGHWHRSHHGWNWVVPAVIGGAVIYSATRPDPVIVQQPIIVQEPPLQVFQGQNCSPWTETQNSDGTITRTRTCAQ